MPTLLLHQLLLVTEKNIGARQSKITMGMQCTNIFAIRSNRVVRLFPMGIGGKVSPSISVRKLILPLSGRIVYPLLKLLLCQMLTHLSDDLELLHAEEFKLFYPSFGAPRDNLWFIAYYNPGPRR